MWYNYVCLERKGTMEYIEALLQAAINVTAHFGGLLIVALAGVMGRWLIQRWFEFRASLPENVAWAIETAAELAVNAVEQLWNSNQIEIYERKNTALEIARRFLEEQGYPDIDLQVVDDAIESILGRLNSEKSA
jgi:hypothetical protein